MRAMWNGHLLAESDDTVVVEGNHYFPRDSVRAELISSDNVTLCPWKGRAHYYTVAVDGDRNPDAAWYYPSPLPAAQQIEDRIAFWNGVTVEH